MKIELSGDDNEFPLYLHIGCGRVFETRELVMGTVFADFDRYGALIGIEFLDSANVHLPRLTP